MGLLSSLRWMVLGSSGRDLTFTVGFSQGGGDGHSNPFLHCCM
jgi:hypothetical protein